MTLNVLWFILIGVLFTGFFFLEGFDYGVGMLLPFMGKDDAERRCILQTIGPFWDANEVWLLTAGGAMFAAFPNWYATLFSGFYLALLLMLLGLILRGIGIEYRNKMPGLRWRRFWDTMIFVGSLLPALLWGVAITNIIRGVPIDARMNYVGSFWDLLSPYALLGGVLFVILFLLHGAVFVSLKTNGYLHHRALTVARLLWVPTVVVTLAFAITGLLTIPAFQHSPVTLLGMGLLALALVLSGLFLWKERSGMAFIMMAVTIVMMTVTVFQGLFPNVMISSLNPAWNLTIYNASSSPYTLTVMSWIALTLVPFTLIYQAWNYWVFRKRIAPVHQQAGY
uniref:Cytochrome c oxidase assembly protein n=1 Tax=Thermosporothrix sp. COM3 TaxID=2490863 RepID=A0A455SSX4_9CHLR|nr:cytochrome c oxidase assembly protein [Thermosporothrix sp. COM3]